MELFVTQQRTRVSDSLIPVFDKQVDELMLRFNTAIYFQIRYKDSISEFEEVLKMSLIVPSLEYYDAKQGKE